MAGPYYTEVWAEAGMGKTHQTHANSPNPVHFDTASSSMSLGDYEIEENPDRKGESWEVIHTKVYDWNEETARNHYRYIDSYKTAINELEELDARFDTVILDNWYDFRTLIIDHMDDQYPSLMQSRGWPKQEGWGKANELYRQFVDAVLETGRHFIVVSEMDDEYNEEGNFTGNRVRQGPKRASFDCDFRVKLEAVDDGNGERRVAQIVKNRLLDRYGDEWVPTLGSEFSFEDLMLISQVPEDEW